MTLAPPYDPPSAAPLHLAVQHPRSASDALPEPESGRRKLALRMLAVLALMMTAGYLGWRVTATMPAGSLWIAVPFLLLEVHAAVGLALFVASTWDVDPPAVPPLPHPPATSTMPCAACRPSSWRSSTPTTCRTGTS